METTKLLLVLLRSAIRGEALTDAEKAFYSPEIISKLAAIAKKHDVLHLLAFGLKKNDLLDENGKKIEAEIFKAVYRQESQNYELKRICEILEQAKIPFIPLKGTIVRTYYPEPWMRTSCDIDILVHEDDAAHAISDLCEAGFVRAEDCTTHDYNLFSPNNVHLELHYTLLQECLPAADKILKDVWQYAAPVQENTHRYAITAEFFLLYHLAHMAKHVVCGGCGIRPFIDLWLLEQRMPYDKEKFHALVTDAGLFEFYSAASALSRVWMESAEPTAQTKLLSGYILSGGVYGTTQNSATVKAAKGEGKAKSFLKLMFLSREHLIVLYPNLKTHPYLLPFYQVKRWFRVFNKSKRDRIKNLTSARNGVLEENVKSTKELLLYLGLSD